MDPAEEPAEEHGPIESAVADLIDELDLDEAPGQPAYAAMAVQLAHTLDAGAGLAVAAVNRELRETIRTLTTGGAGHDGDPRTADLLARLSTPLGYTSN